MLGEHPEHRTAHRHWRRIDTPVTLGHPRSTVGRHLRSIRTMDLDFDSREETNDFITVPAGTYLCRIAEVRERLTRSEDVLWAIRLDVIEGEFVGRLAAWDNLVFSSRGLTRVKRFLDALGLPSDGKVQLSPDDLVDQKVFAEVRPAEYHAPDGNMTRRNEIPYNGYRAIQVGTSQVGSKEGVTAEDDPLPF